jgi:hypothetical protein
LNVLDKSADQVFSIKRYSELASKVGATIITIGHSAQNRPINVLKKGSGKLKVLFVTRIHGNEPATTEALLEFFEENSFDNIELYGIYLANPDGAALYEDLWSKNTEAFWQNNFNDARLNANQMDINRDWLELSQKETQAIQKFILTLRPDFAADFHEYYWSDKGYPPKYPTDDKDGFLATMTDAPFFGADNYVKDLSEQTMNYLINKLENDFEWKIKTRHFIGEPQNTYSNPTFLGVYLALRGIPKLLVETWGVACSTLLLDKRIAFHKKAMRYLIEWIDINQSKFYSKPESLEKIEYHFEDTDQYKINAFKYKLDLHGIKYEMKNNENIIIYCSSLEIGFINTIHYLIYKRENVK